MPHGINAAVSRPSFDPGCLAALGMFAAPFRYVSPTSLEEALALLAEHGSGAKVLAGGQSLIPLMKLRLAAPQILIDIGRVGTLRTVEEAGKELRLGPMVTEAQLEESRLLRSRYPALVDTSSVIADPIVRNLATVGGNIAHGDPANDHPATMVALGARFSLAGPTGRRWVLAEDFFTDLFETSARTDEILTEIRLPIALPGHGAAYEKYERQVGDYAVAGAAVAVHITDNRFRDVRIALTNLGAIPQRARAAEDTMRGQPVGSQALDAVGRMAADSTDPWEDSRGSADYKRRVAASVTTHALRRAIERATIQ
jgi:carbon-monoxide dehydrogenase medium subunit